MATYLEKLTRELIAREKELRRELKSIEAVRSALKSPNGKSPPRRAPRKRQGS